MKPRISIIRWNGEPLINGWLCTDGLALGTGPTPEAAYREWIAYRRSREASTMRLDLVHRGPTPQPQPIGTWHGPPPEPIALPYVMGRERIVAPGRQSRWVDFTLDCRLPSIKPATFVDLTNSIRFSDPDDPRNNGMFGPNRGEDGV